MIKYLVKKKSIITKILIFKSPIFKEDFQVFLNAQIMRKVIKFPKKRKNKEKLIPLIKRLELMLQDYFYICLNTIADLLKHIGKCV
jgi:hypothetical protein